MKRISIERRPKATPVLISKTSDGNGVRLNINLTKGEAVNETSNKTDKTDEDTLPGPLTKIAGSNINIETNSQSLSGPIKIELNKVKPIKKDNDTDSLTQNASWRSARDKKNETKFNDEKPYKRSKGYNNNNNINDLISSPDESIRSNEGKNYDLKQKTKKLKNPEKNGQQNLFSSLFKSDLENKKDMIKKKKELLYSTLDSKTIEQINFIINYFREFNSASKSNPRTVLPKIIKDLSVLKDFLAFIHMNLKDITEISQEIAMEIIKLFMNPFVINCNDQNKIDLICSIFFNENGFYFGDILFTIITQEENFCLSGTDQDLLYVNKFLIYLTNTKNKNLQSVIIFLRNIVYHFNDMEMKNIYRKLLTDLQIKELANSNIPNIVPNIEMIECPPSLQDLTNEYEKKWDSFENYQKVMYNLTLENYFIPLRQYLKELRAGTLNKADLFLYEKVSIYPMISNDEAFNQSTLFVHFQIRTPPNSKTPAFTSDWSISKRCQYRSLLFFSSSPFLDNIDAVGTSVSQARIKQEETKMKHLNLLNKNILPVSLLGGSLEMDKEYYMFEPTGCWAASYPILNRLNKMNKSTFPKCLIKPFLEFDISSNEIKDNPKVNLSILFQNAIKHKMPPQKNSIKNDERYINDLIEQQQQFEVQVKDKWEFDDFEESDFNSFLDVDHEQYKPLKYAASHHITLINGAPGTGKTHFAKEFTKLLLNSNHQYPIVVTTYKNQELDGYLNGMKDFLKKYEIKFVRYGGTPRTTDKFILSHNWHFCFKSEEVERMKEKVTQHNTYLKNLNSFRQLAYKCITELKSIKIDSAFQVISTELDKIIDFSLMLEKYFQVFTQQEISSMVSKKIPIPTLSSFEYFCCWFIGSNYFKQISAKYRDQYQNDLKKYKESKEKGEINKVVKFDNKENEKIISFDDENENDDEDYMNQLDFQINQIQCRRLLPDKVIEYIKNQFIIMISSDSDKLILFHAFFKQCLVIVNEYIIKKEKKCLKLKEELSKTEIIEAGRFMSGMQLIAITGTVASLMKEAIEIANVQVMIVEEAGELTEPMISCIIPRTLNQILLIGDYQQLRPSVEYKLTFKPYNHHISLFERLVVDAKKYKKPYLHTLTIQRRMHPQISSLLRSVFYTGEEKLNDDPSTKFHRKPFGFSSHIQFWLHNFDEDSPSNSEISRSHSNIKEAKICAYLFMMMLCRGYKVDEITIIALYKGQKGAIEKEIINLMNNDQIKDPTWGIFDIFEGNEKYEVKCLDDFQGEENKVIIVSLTRSEKPGFVKNENRALVTLSRAREMEFVIGNDKIFGPNAKNNELWSRISSNVRKINIHSCSNNGIFVKSCRLHSQKKEIKVLSSPADFIKYRFNYCEMKCPSALKCGHNCELTCHLDILHGDRYWCPQQCKKKCKNGHQCQSTCGECCHIDCPPCSYQCNCKCEINNCHYDCAKNCCHDGTHLCSFESYCKKCNAQIHIYHGQSSLCGNCFKNES